MKVAFITWDGPDQNYLESLFLPTFEAASGADLSFSVLQFTWGDPSIRESIAEAAAAAGIPYEVHPVLRRPLNLATGAMIVAGAMRVVAHVRKHDIDVVMPRSIIPAAMVLLARRKLPDLRVVYDSDGFMADERVEFSGWSSQGMTYRLFRDVEAQISRVSRSVMVRTMQGRRIMRERIGPELSEDRIVVVPNGKDSTHFSVPTEKNRQMMRKIHGIPDDAPLVIYAGSLGPQYMPESIFDFFHRVRLRDPESQLIILTGNEDIARSVMRRWDFPTGSVIVKRVAPDEVASHLGAADLGLAFRQPTFSQRGVSPIKIAEYLLCGLPTLATTGVGDVESQLDSSVGIVIDDVEPETLDRAVGEFFDRIRPKQEAFRQRCRQLGVTAFSLEYAVRGYRKALGVA